MLANMSGIAAPTPPAMAPPTTKAVPPMTRTAVTASSETLECSASPTNTSGSDVSGLSSSELAAILLAGQQNAVKQEFPETHVKSELPPIANPLFGMSDAAALLQFLQAQQAIAQFHAQAQAAAQQRVAIQQQQQSTPPERKRSYPCTFQFCVICQKDVHSSKLPCHIRQCHVAKPMFQCPACDFTSTYSKNNVKSHMVSLHGLAGDPISYMDKYAAQVDEFMKMCFPNVRGRGRPMQGRSSPRSPTSPQSSARKTSQQSSGLRRPSMVLPQHEMLALQQQQALFAAAQGINPLSIFPQMVNNNNKLTSAVLDPKLNQPECKIPKMENADSLDNGVSSSGSAEEVRNKSTSGRTLSNFVLSMRPQTSRPGESVQPRYLKAIPACTVLDEEQVKDTVFDAAPAALTSEVAEYVHDQVEDDNSLLDEAQQQKVSELLKQVNLKKFEIEFSIHSVGRLDMTVLPLERASLVLEAVPSAADVERIRRFTAAHPNNQWTEAEQFVIDLANIERAEEKLTAMVHTAKFDSIIDNINEHLDAYSCAAKLVQESEQLRLIVQTILALLNHLNGSTMAEKVVGGFCTSQLAEICSSPISGGSSLLQTVASFIRDRAPHATDVADLVEPLKKASEEPFLSLYASLLQLDEGNQHVQLELEQLDFEHPVLAVRLNEMRRRVEEVADKLVRVKDQLLVMLSYMGEALPRTESEFRPEDYLSKLCDFLTSLHLHNELDVEVEN
ncbi:unnamed protein product [Cylicocyclus nassatus]|uniref:FH2 domain-containing protein n=1 Tax=Cylicocyclus nassatus TaxID=53992 RepID=A0AA36GT00_CYLNA|nr:unnamed protein product [Cylicocyclus nassatus]